MDDKKRKPVIGILGGVGSGKSTAAAEFARLGCAVIDADRIAHQLLKEAQVKDKLITIFGTDIVGKDGNIDRMLSRNRILRRQQIIVVKQVNSPRGISPDAAADRRISKRPLGQSDSSGYAAFDGSWLG